MKSRFTSVPFDTSTCKKMRSILIWTYLFYRCRPGFSPRCFKCSTWWWPEVPSYSERTWITM